MGIARKVGLTVLAAAASVALVPGVAAADPAEHQIRYTLTQAEGATFDLYYLASQPPSKQAYDADAYKYLKHESIDLAPGQTWTFDTTLSDPTWAIFTVSSTTHGGRPAPMATCEISVDGQSAVHNSADYNPRCDLKNWVGGAAPAAQQNTPAAATPADATPTAATPGDATAADAVPAAADAAAVGDAPA